MALLCCITLISMLAAGYFAWLANDVQERFNKENTVIAIDPPIIKTEDEHENPPLTGTDAQLIQVPFVTDVPEGKTALSATLDNWSDANAQVSYCANVRNYATSDAMRQFGVPAKEMLTDAGVRSALVAYFNVRTENQETFFAGIESVIDEDDRFKFGNTMCSGNGRKFLLLEYEYGPSDEVEMVSGLPQVLEWDAVAGSWIVYPLSIYRAMDGYTFIPDWNGSAILYTGYGDAGYMDWVYQRLDIQDNVPTLTFLEGCSVSPVQNPELICEVRYTE